MNILILGPPGTGKGTQAKLICDKYGFKHISTGEIFRSEYAGRTKLGLEAHDQYWGKGNLVPDDLTIDLVRSSVKEKDELLLDGFPRTLYQARNCPFIIQKVIFLNSTEDNLVRRLLNRAKLEKRADDTEEVIKNRLEVYQRETAPLLNFYKKILISVDGDGSIEEVFEGIERQIFKKK